MNDPADLESMLRSLRPGNLPQDLRQRLATPPDAMPVARPVARRLLFILSAGTLAAAACVILLSRQPETHHAQPAPLTIHHQESTLIHSRTLGYVEHDGCVWSLQDQQWKDDEIACCSNSTVRVRLTRDRHELVYQPVSFD